MIDVVQQSLFDYGSLDADTRVFVQEQEAQLDCVLKRTSKEIGAILLNVKQRLPHGQYMPWLASRGISESTAWRCMQVAQGKEIGKSFIMKDLPLEAKQAETFIEGESIPTFPPGFGLVNGKPFDMPLPDGKPIDKEEFERVFPPLHRPVEIDRGSHDVDPLPIVNRGVPAALQSSDSNEWYTPADYVEAARALMGDIDVDPASCELANQVIQAKRYFTKRDNGLKQSWAGRVWLNPPYGFDGGMSNQEIWTRQLIERYKAGLTTEAILLVNANTEAKWFQPLYEFLICLTNHRIRFYNTSGESSQPTQGNALVYFGKNETRFIEIFSRFGVVVRRADGR